LGTFIACPWSSLLFVALNVSRNLFRLEDFKAIPKLTLFFKTELENLPDFFSELVKIHSLVHGFEHIFLFLTNGLISSVKRLFEQT
jgi:hypothetical protein